MSKTPVILTAGSPLTVAVSSTSTSFTYGVRSNCSMPVGWPGGRETLCHTPPDFIQASAPRMTTLTSGNPGTSGA